MSKKSFFDKPMTAWAELFLKMLQIRDSLSKSRTKGTFMQIM